MKGGYGVNALLSRIILRKFQLNFSTLGYNKKQKVCLS